MMSALFRWAVWLWVVGAALGVVLGFLGPLHYDLDAFSYFRPHFGLLALIGGFLAFGLPRRRVKWIGFGAAALAFALLGPVWRGVEQPPRDGVKTRSVTIMTANVLARNPTLDLTVSVLLAANADILATQETPGSMSQAPSPLAQHYPYTTAQAGARHGVILWSKFPLRRIETGHADRNAPAFVTAHVDLGGGAGIGVTAVHLSWPLIADGAQGKQIAVLGSLLPAEPGPKVLAGDFNAAPWSEAMKRVEAKTDLRLIGGLRRTWLGGYPNPLHYLRTGDLYGKPIPALLGHHIDQVLLSRDIGVDAVEVIPLPGSDHRAVWTKLTVPLRPQGNLFAGG